MKFDIILITIISDPCIIVLNISRNVSESLHSYQSGPTNSLNRTPTSQHDQRRENQSQQKRRACYNNNSNRSHAAYFRNRRPSTNNIIIHGYPAPFPPKYVFIDTYNTL